MRRIIFITFLLLSFVSYGQKVNYSIKLSYNQPYIKDVKQNTYYLMTQTGENVESFSSKSGGKFCANLNYKLSTYLFIEGGFQLNLIRYQRVKQHVSNGWSWDELTQEEHIREYGLVVDGILYDSDGNTITSDPENYYFNYWYQNSATSSDDLGNTSIFYLDIPMNLGYTFFNNKLKCKLGFIMSILGYSEIQTRVNNDNFNYYSQIQYEKDDSSDGLTNVVWSGAIGLEYLVYKNIGLSLDYSRSLNSIYDKGVSIGKPKFNVFSFGVTYNFL